ncbi:hypothetical protein DF186_15435, partial [Enterococcus hirae]
WQRGKGCAVIIIQSSLLFRVYFFTVAAVFVILSGAAGEREVRGEERDRSRRERARAGEEEAV